jgi:Tol biopolymer transport system component
MDGLSFFQTIPQVIGRQNAPPVLLKTLAKIEIALTEIRNKLAPSGHSKENTVKRSQLALPIVLTLAAIFLTVGCGSSNHSNPVFTQMAFWSDRNSDDHLNVMNLDGSGRTAVPFTNDSSSVYSPSISADGTKIALNSDEQLWTSNMSGSTQSQVTIGGVSSYASRLSPNGKLIVGSQSVNSSETLVVTNLDGSGAVNLTSPYPATMTSCWAASFSADSKQVVFTCEGSSTYGLYTIHADGTGLTTVYTEADNYLDSPAFTPDGKTIIFVIDDGAQYGVNSIPVAGGSPTLLVPNVYDVEVLNSNMFYTNLDTNLEAYRIYKANLDGTSPVAITDGTSDDWVYVYTD